MQQDESHEGYGTMAEADITGDETALINDPKAGTQGYTKKISLLEKAKAFFRLASTDSASVALIASAVEDAVLIDQDAADARYLGIHDKADSAAQADDATADGALDDRITALEEAPAGLPATLEGLETPENLNAAAVASLATGIAAQGVPRYFKYSVDFDDFPAIGGLLTLFTPAAGDLVTHFFINPYTFVAWDAGDSILLGEAPNWDDSTQWGGGDPKAAPVNDGDFQMDSVGNSANALSVNPWKDNNAPGDSYGVSGHVCSGVPIQLLYTNLQVFDIELTGAPEAGTFTLLVNGVETSAIPFDDDGTVMAAAIAAIAPGASASGSALPTGPVTAYIPAATLAAGTNSLTGGTTPAISVTQTGGFAPGVGHFDIYFARTTPIAG